MFAHTTVRFSLRGLEDLAPAKEEDILHISTDEDIASLALKPLDELSDDELALVAERALKTKSERHLAEYAECQRLALRHLRRVVSDALNESSQDHVGV